MGNRVKQRSRIRRRQILFPFLLPLFWGVPSEQIRYSIPEETVRGSVVGNVAEDMGLHVQDLLTRNLRVSTEEQYFTVNTENGNILVTATDQDEDVNAEITYSFKSLPDDIGNTFVLDHQNGESKSKDLIDFEIYSSYTMSIEAKDGGDMTSECKIILEILDENDNAPDVVFTSVSSSMGPWIGTPEYKLTITATVRGKPPLSSSTSITLCTGDVNDSAPVFHQVSYGVHVAENNPPGASITQVSASDLDLGLNGQVSCSIVTSDLELRAPSSYVSQQRAFEQLRALEFKLQAHDQGSPALSANVSLHVLVGDLNDNVWQVLYPALGSDGSAVFDMVPRAAESGYLVTKVAALDADLGHKDWLSYHLLQAIQPGLFSLGLPTGEVRTARALGYSDSARQRLLVAVHYGGQLPLSATATLHVVFADSLQKALPDFIDGPVASDSQAKLQIYLVVALALISMLFFLAVILAVSLSSPSAWGWFHPGLCSKTRLGFLPTTMRELCFIPAICMFPRILEKEDLIFSP
ncbi:hypothetical protein H8959_021173 [Pygathrix nigripes]